jgi:malonyl-CoA/methylmalonyl-CoA synthetase
VLRDVDGLWISGGELDERSGAEALNLRRAGFAPGDRLMLCGPSSAAFVIAYVAALRAGLVTVPINPAYTCAEVQRIVADARPAAALVPDREHARWIEQASPDPISIFGIDLEPPVAKRAHAAQSGDPPIDCAALEDPAVMLYTSGTTGRPKGAPLSHGNLLASATAIARAWRWTAADRLLLALPLFHMHGLGVGINGSLAAGAQLVLRAGFDVGDVVARSGEGVSLFFGVPAMYQRLAAAGHAGALAPLRLLVSGSAPLAADLGHLIARQSGQFPLERYGMTETVMLTSNPIDGPRKPGKVGLPLPGVELRLGAGGEVQVRGPNVFAGYYHRPDADAEAFTVDGDGDGDGEAFMTERWFRTGDLGELDADGHLRLVGRSKELIISGGFNVHPREVEEVIERYPGVHEVAVIGRPSEAWGEAVTAVVVCEGPIDVAELRAHAAAQLAPYKVPKQIEFVSELPRNALGKLLRHEL